MPSLSCVFLDAAGTLFHLRERVGTTYARFAARHGVDLDSAVLDAQFRIAWKSLPPPLHPTGQPAADDDRSWWKELVRRTVMLPDAPKMEEPAFESFFSEVYAYYGCPEPWELFKDTLPALEKLHQSHRLFVVSNFDRRLRDIMEGLQLSQFFTGVFVSSELGASKPHPRLFEAALAQAKAPPSACLHIGDDPRCDLEGAQALGIHARILHRPEVTLLTLAEEISKFSH